MAVERDVQSFARLVDALRPQLTAVVFVGGWAHRLHRLHPYAQPLEYAPLMTRDADVAVPPRAFAESDIRAQLFAANFQERFIADHQPPVTRYELGDEAGAFYAEFLTPLVGGENRRDGTPDVTVKIGRVSAQKLRYLDVLLHQPWTLRLDRGNGFPFYQPTDVLVPNAAAYIAQKILIHGKRRPEEQARDVLYVHDTIETFGRSLERLQVEWREHVRPELSRRAVQAVEGGAASMFGDVSDVIRNAAIQARQAGRTLSSKTLRLAGETGLRAILS
jgi:hypothetical protein